MVWPKNKNFKLAIFKNLDGSPGVQVEFGEKESNLFGSFSWSHPTNFDCTNNRQGDFAFGIEEINKNTISIYPNPTSDIITISAENLTISQINIYNQLGQQMPIDPGTSIDVSTFPKGLYIVEIETEDGTFREKILVE